MEVLYPKCAGLDVHKKTVVACVRIQQGQSVEQEVRTLTPRRPACWPSWRGFRRRAARSRPWKPPALLEAGVARARGWLSSSWCWPTPSTCATCRSQDGREGRGVVGRSSGARLGPSQLCPRIADRGAARPDPHAPSAGASAGLRHVHASRRRSKTPTSSSTRSSATFWARAAGRMVESLIAGQTDPIVVEGLVKLANARLHAPARTNRRGAARAT